MRECKLILTRGIQGSGKSTWAKAWVKEDPLNRIRFNNDDINHVLRRLRNLLFNVIWNLVMILLLII